jgi:DNA polymerase elongation subunit (family B)
MGESNDHDVLVRLCQSVEDFHNETRRTLSEIKNDFKRQLSDHERRLGKLETANTRQNAMLWIILVVGSFLSALLIYHVAGIKL